TAGTYTVTVTDDDGCTVQSSYTVTQPAAISVSMSKTNASCANNDGTATATPSGGVSPYSYLWAPGGETTQQITGLAGGSYTCTVTDDNTCSSSGNITVSTTACGPTLTPASCGMTATSLSNNIYTVAVANATNYRYKFVNAAQGFNQIFVKGNSSTYFVLTAAAGIQYGRIYDVTVSAYVSGAWTSFGAVCTVTTPAFPTTKLITSDCGITVGTITETVFCDIVPGRQKYQWKLVDQVSSTTYTYIRNGPAENFCMSWISGIQYGKTYDVQVRAMVGGVWGSYGPVCTLTSPAVPTPQLTAAYCGATLANASGQIFCTAVSGATNYIWKIENSSLGYSETRVRGNYNTNYWLSWNTGLQVNTTYTVTIRAYVNGAWGVYGNPCTITTGPTMLAPEEQSGPVPSELRLVNEEPIGTLEVYPNPCVEKIAIISAERIRTVVMYNALGERVHSILVNNTSAEINMTQLPAGLYFIYAETAEGTLIRKVLKE
ncbi:MAG TPA: T9SS type A sorting domain-containing protein, partial [Bacteroidia bacterium]|nr:T9SS type A sorting domain-containing protein [Bacteroidia bacterium]